MYDQVGEEGLKSGGASGGGFQRGPAGAGGSHQEFHFQGSDPFDMFR